MTLAEHWDDRYENNPASKLSWYQERSPEVDFISDNVGKATPIIDIGGGLSPFVHELIAREFTDLSVLDISQFALDEGARNVEGRKVDWIQANVTQWTSQANVWSVARSRGISFLNGRARSTELLFHGQ